MPKTVYATLDEAIEDAKELNALGTSTYKAVAYYCRTCHKYHVGRNETLLTEVIVQKLRTEGYGHKIWKAPERGLGTRFENERPSQGLVGSTPTSSAAVGEHPNGEESAWKADAPLKGVASSNLAFSARSSGGSMERAQVILIGAHVKFVGRPCPRTTEACLMHGAVLTVKNVHGALLKPELRKYGFAENELLLMPEDLEVINEEETPF